MGKRFLNIVFGLFTVSLLSACAGGAKHRDVAAPLPPMTDISVSQVELEQIQPTTGVAMAQHNAAKTSCGFSSFHRKHTLGYEFNESNHLALKVSPKVDIWNPTDFETKVSLRFTRALGGAANKRPKCTYGSGFYGLLPYATNEGVNVGGLLDGEKIKSFAEDKLQERERRRKEREAKAELSL